MKKRIIYLGYLELTKYTVENFYLSTLSENGYDVTYWDLSSLFFKTVPQKSIKKIDNIIVEQINSYSVLAKLINKNSKSLYILLMSFDGRIFRLYYLLNKYGCQTMTFHLFSMPFYNLKKKKYYLLHKLIHLKRKNLIYKLNLEFMVFLIKCKYMNYFDYVLTSGNIGNLYIKKYFSKNQTCISRSKILSFNTTDYNIFINNKYSSTTLDYPYILFIDEYYPFHPDTLLFNGKFNMDPNEYFTQINSVFSLFEKKYSMPVVIAAHPKAVKYKDNNFFNNRLVFFEKTADLVKGCKFVITHDSTALNYAIFNKKPIFLLKSSIIKEALPDNYNIIDNLAVFLDSYLYDMDDRFLWKLPDTVELSENQKALYSTLINKYHKAENSIQSNEELILQYVKEIFSK